MKLEKSSFYHLLVICYSCDMEIGVNNNSNIPNDEDMLIMDIFYKVSNFILSKCTRLKKELTHQGCINQVLKSILLYMKNQTLLRCGFIYYFGNLIQCFRHIRCTFSIFKNREQQFSRQLLYFYAIKNLRKIHSDTLLSLILKQTYVSLTGASLYIFFKYLLGIF